MEVLCLLGIPSNVPGKTCCAKLIRPCRKLLRQFVEALLEISPDHMLSGLWVFLDYGFDRVADLGFRAFQGPRVEQHRGLLREFLGRGELTRRRPPERVKEL